MVERVRKDSDTQREGAGAAVFSVSHFPQKGGVKVFEISKDAEAFYVRLGYFDKSKNVSDQLTMKLDKNEVSGLLVSLMRELLGGRGYVGSD